MEKGAASNEHPEQSVPVGKAHHANSTLLDEDLRRVCRCNNGSVQVNNGRVIHGNHADGCKCGNTGVAVIKRYTRDNPWGRAVRGTQT